MDQDWAGLPQHLLDIILEKVGSFTDYLHFGAVCLSWHSTLKDNISTPLDKLLRQHQATLLLFPDKEEDKWSIYNVMDNKLLELKLSLSYKRRFSGSSEGWLVVVNENHSVMLHKPDFVAKEKHSQAGININLPCLFPPDEIEDIEDWEPEDLEFIREVEAGYDYYVVKALITADPLVNSENCTIVVTFGGNCEITCIRYNKDPTWIEIADVKGFDDILYHENKVYALGFQGKLISFDTADPCTKKHITPDFPICTCCRRYLVESCGELLQVERLLSINSDIVRSTNMFKVYRIDFDEGKWIEIKDLGGAAVFIGDNSSISVGFHPNCIYFTHDYIGIRSSKGSGLGIYNVKTGSFKLHYSIEPNTFSRMVDRPPIWVVPIPKV